MDMEYFLPGWLPIREKQVHAFTPKSGFAKSAQTPLTYTHQMAGNFWIKVRERRRVLVRNHEEMSGINWLDIRERRAPIVSIHKAGRFAPIKQLAEDAVTFFRFDFEHFVLRGLGVNYIRS